MSFEASLLPAEDSGLLFELGLLYEGLTFVSD